MTQRDDRIDAGRAQGWKNAGGKRHEREQYRRDTKGDRVARIEAEEQRRQLR
jgi:hypothetical protein